MFGKLNETILFEIEQNITNGSEDKMKSQFGEYTKLLKGNKALVEFFKIYDLYKTKTFEDDEVSAFVFVEETVKHLVEQKKLITNQLTKMKELVKESSIKLPDYIDALDFIIFDSGNNIIENADRKVKLIKHLTGKKTEIQNIDSLHKTLISKIEKMDEKQRDVVEAFLSGDTNLINETYTQLIEDATILINNQLKNANDIDLVKQLVEVNLRINDIKKQEPNISNANKLLDLLS